VAERYERGRLLDSHNPRDSRDAEHIAFLERAAPSRAIAFGAHDYTALGYSAARGYLLCANVYHYGVALLVKMREICHGIISVVRCFFRCFCILSIVYKGFAVKHFC